MSPGRLSRQERGCDRLRFLIENEPGFVDKKDRVTGIAYREKRTGPA
jgi:hypothetical protein